MHKVWRRPLPAVSEMVQRGLAKATSGSGLRQREPVIALCDSLSGIRRLAGEATSRRETNHASACTRIMFTRGIGLALFSVFTNV
jgi:hypothetical protein